MSISVPCAPAPVLKGAAPLGAGCLGGSSCSAPLPCGQGTLCREMDLIDDRRSLMWLACNSAPKSGELLLQVAEQSNEEHCRICQLKSREKITQQRCVLACKEMKSKGKESQPQEQKSRDAQPQEGAGRESK